MTVPLTQEERRDLLVSIGTHRGERRLSPVDVAQLFQKAAGAGASLAQCASAAGLVGTDMVKRFLRLLELPPSVQATVAWRRSETTLSFTAATELARLPNALQKPAAREVLARGLSSSEVKQAVQRSTRGGIDPREAISEILALRPIVERRHVFIGMLSVPTAERRIEALGQGERNTLLSAALCALIGEQHASVRLTPTGFVIAGDDDVADAMRRLGDFETIISSAVAQQLGLA